jgi:hypothetical protein
MISSREWYIPYKHAANNPTEIASESEPHLLLLLAATNATTSVVYAAPTPSMALTEVQPSCGGAGIQILVAAACSGI